MPKKRKRNVPPESKIIDGEKWKRPPERIKNYGYRNRSRASTMCSLYREYGYDCKIIPVGTYHVIYRRKK